MKPLKFWFVLIMTVVTTLAIFLIADIVLAGIMYLVIMIWDKVLALNVFKWFIIILFGLQILFTIPFTVKSIRKGED